MRFAGKEKALRHGKAPVANHRLSYLAFALRLIFPCAQHSFNVGE